MIFKHNKLNYLRHIFLAGLLGLFLGGASQGAEPVRLALIPLQINAPERLNYLRDGLLDILASRLAWEGRVVVLDKDTVGQALAKVPGPMNEEKARQIGRSLDAGFVLFGSLTQVGSGTSIDLRVVALDRGTPAEKFFGETRGLDDIIPRVDALTEDINAQMFKRPRTAVTTSPAASPGVGPAGSLAAQKSGGIDLKDFTLRPLSPQIIMNAGGFDLAGVWRSSILPYALRDMDFGDLDGDGNLETVIISQTGIHIYRFKDDRLNRITEIAGNRNDNYIAVDVADINGTGRPQIFVSNFRKDGTRSLVLAWENGSYKTVAKNLPYTFRVHQLPERGTVLLGQERRGNYAFGTKIKVLSWQGGRYEPLEELNLPDEVNVYNFVKRDLNGDGAPETVYIDKKNHLVVLSSQGKEEYRGNDFYGGTINFLDMSNFDSSAGGLTTTIMSDQAGRTYIPARLVVIPGRSSDKAELILNKNKDSIFNVMDRFVSYSSGVIYSLSWDGATFKENWRTMTINDYLANYGVADFRNNRQKQLVVGIVQSRGLPLIGNARSLIYCYDLGVVQFEKK